MTRKANYLLQTFAPCDPFVKVKLIESYCLSLCGAVLCNLGCKQIKSLEIAFNSILRKIWRLPRQCNTRILHLIACSSSLVNKIVGVFTKFANRACMSHSPLIKHTFLSARYVVYTPMGYNMQNKDSLVKQYSEDDHLCADFVRSLRLGHIDFSSTTIEDIIYTVCCSWVRYIYLP